MSMLNVVSISESLFYRYQAEFVVPAIDMMYEASMMCAQQAVVESGSLLTLLETVYIELRQ